MSRVAKQPIVLPKQVEVAFAGVCLTVKGPKGQSALNIPAVLSIDQADSVLKVSINEAETKKLPRGSSLNPRALSGTFRALVQNMVTGVSAGFERGLELHGVGYRAQAQESKLTLTLGFSHPVEFKVPKEVTVETPTQTIIVVKGIDKQQVGQVAAKIREFRPPNPYKGAGVRYAGEVILRKEVKKK